MRRGLLLGVLVAILIIMMAGYFGYVKADYDEDGLTNDQEWKYGTDINNPDTDSDGLKDGEEVETYKTNPKALDTDADGLKDGEEIKTGTDPLKVDTDGDGIIDGKDPYPLSLYTLIVRIIWDDNAPEKGAFVQLSGEIFSETYTNDTGYSVFNNLRAGSYDLLVLVNRPAYAHREERTFKISERSPSKIFLVIKLGNLNLLDRYLPYEDFYRTVVSLNGYDGIVLDDELLWISILFDIYNSSSYLRQIPYDTLLWWAYRATGDFGGVGPKYRFDPSFFRDNLIPLAKNITTGTVGQMDSVLLIVDWVQRNIRYGIPPPEDTPKDILKTMSGRCDNFATLIVALCKAIGIPAREIYLCGTRGLTHAAIECYINHTWVLIPSTGILNRHSPPDWIDNNDIKAWHWKIVEADSWLIVNGTVIKFDSTFAYNYEVTFTLIKYIETLDLDSEAQKLLTETRHYYQQYWNAFDIQKKCSLNEKSFKHALKALLLTEYGIVVANDAILNIQRSWSAVEKMAVKRVNTIVLYDIAMNRTVAPQGRRFGEFPLEQLIYTMNLCRELNPDIKVWIFTPTYVVLEGRPLIEPSLELLVINPDEIRLLYRIDNTFQETAPEFLRNFVEEILNVNRTGIATKFRFPLLLNGSQYNFRGWIHLPRGWPLNRSRFYFGILVNYYIKNVMICVEYEAWWAIFNNIKIVDIEGNVVIEPPYNFGKACGIAFILPSNQIITINRSDDLLVLVVKRYILTPEYPLH
jgi:transglutaminase-like putative cysteine protease